MMMEPTTKRSLAIIAIGQCLQRRHVTHACGGGGAWGWRRQCEPRLDPRRPPPTVSPPLVYGRVCDYEFCYISTGHYLGESCAVVIITFISLFFFYFKYLISYFEFTRLELLKVLRISFLKLVNVNIKIINTLLLFLDTVSYVKTGILFNYY